MRNVAVVFIALLILACGPGTNATSNRAETSRPDQDFSFTPKQARQYPLVTNSNAPTIAELKARGFDQTGGDAEMYACAPSCDAIYVYAVFVGRKATYAVVDKLPGVKERPGRKYRVETKKAEHLFTCPNPEKPMREDDWKCGKFAGMKVRRNG